MRPYGPAFTPRKCAEPGGWDSRYEGIDGVGLSEIDRNLLERCLQKKSRAWEDFVDRFMGLVIHVINHSAQARSIRLGPQDRDDLCAEVFLAIIKGDFSLLRNFRGQSSLATYLTVVARRIVVRELLNRQSMARLTETTVEDTLPRPADPQVEQRLSDQEEVRRLLGGLQETEAQVVRLFHLEGKSYREISTVLGMPENSVGSILSRADQSSAARASIRQQVERKAASAASLVGRPELAFRTRQFLQLVATQSLAS